MKRFFLIFISILAILVIAGLVSSYQPGVDVEELKLKYVLPDSEFIQINDLNVHLRKTGTGPTILLLHGVASSLHTWKAWQDQLSDQFTVISIDVPGFGLTGGFPDGEYSVEKYMLFLDELLSQLKIDSCYMAGNSFGGYLTWNYGLRQPAKIKKIILLNAGGYPKKIWENDLGFFISKYRATDWFTHFFTPKSLLRRSVANAYKHDEKIKEETIQRYFDLLVRDGNRQNFSKILRMMPRQEGNSERLKQLEQPTLIMWGDEDQIIPVRNADKFNEDIPHSTLIWYDSGHIPMEEDPEPTVRDARAFFSN